ncbi:hypothetical protein [Magnetospirillum moscoviense]|uniref:Uncharacterized protein n=1 Tax=Magnetospirillum moscoviense TaxID=1437059 RepID=A0A178MMN2_9PROT|nr:hypothetical protein [Magnetospirillum moscoviense]OAN50030.1 hypothetical protein A6A05_02115 [Magnetospirillum moscoviense]
MRLLVLITLFGFLPLATAHADSVVAACPSEWTFGTQKQRLLWANTWADDGAIDNSHGDDPVESPGRAIIRIDMAKVTQRPLFLYCRYKEMRGFNLAVSIPEGVKTCLVEWQGTEWDAREKVNRHYVRTLRAECRGTAHGEPSRVYPAEIPAPTSDIEGLRLRRSAEELKALVLSRGGTWTQWAEGAPADISFGEIKLRVGFSLSTGLSRKIILYGPPWPPRDPGFYASIIQRFGFPDTPYGDRCSRIWNAIGARKHIQVEWYRPCNTDSASAPQEMRLVDMADPQSMKDRK